MERVTLDEALGEVGATRFASKGVVNFHNDNEYFDVHSAMGNGAYNQFFQELSELVMKTYDGFGNEEDLKGYIDSIFYSGFAENDDEAKMGSNGFKGFFDTLKESGIEERVLWNIFYPVDAVVWGIRHYQKSSIQAFRGTNGALLLLSGVRGPVDHYSRSDQDLGNGNRFGIIADDQIAFYSLRDQ